MMLKVSTWQIALVGIILSAVCVGVNWFLLVKAEQEVYHFHKLSDRTVHHQKTCLTEFLDVFKTLMTPMLLIDMDILPLLFRSRPKEWHASDHKCKQLCKLHPEEKHVVSFAAEAAHFVVKMPDIMRMLSAHNFSLHLSLVKNQSSIDGEYLPTYLWLAKKDHIIQLAFLHRRNSHIKDAEYLWVGPITDEHWNETVRALAPVLTDGWHDMERMGLKFPRYEHAFDITHNLLAVPTDIDGHQVAVPYHIDKFMKMYQGSKFLTCNQTKATEFRKSFHKAFPPPTSNELRNLRDMVEVLRITKYVFDIKDYSFWLTGDLLLDWYRECNISRFQKDLEIGVWASEFDSVEKVNELIQHLEFQNLTLVHTFGQLSDSYEIRFHLDTNENVNINILFFYEDGDVIWNGRTDHFVNQKYKYRFPRPEFCWTEFVYYKVQIPCDTHTYVTTMFGDKWNVLVPSSRRKHSDSNNMDLNGYWLQKEWKEAIVHHKKSSASF